MIRKLGKPATKGEEEYTRSLEHESAFDRLDRGKAEVLDLDDYPESIKRFIQRERTMVHVKLSLAAKRKLEMLSRESGTPAQELARKWIERELG